MMRILFDSHSWLWLQTTPERLSADALRSVEDPANELILSVASAWEISIKYALGKLVLPRPPMDYFTERIPTSGVVPMPISLSHALHVATLPMHHRDPFDRILIAQAQLESLTVLTSDRRFGSYDVDVLWAR